MSDANDLNGPTIDGPLSSAEWVRRRFAAACEEWAPGQPPPDVEKFLAPVPEPERTQLRHNLESLARLYWERGPKGDAPVVTGSPASDPVVYHADLLAEDERTLSQATAAPESGQAGSGAKALGVWETPSTSPTGAPGQRTGTTPEDEELEQPRPDPGLPTIPGYEVLGVLGRGAMGVVYKARQVGLNRLVALKMILAGEHAGSHEVVRFRTEAEAVARLQHPNIVQIYEVGAENGRPYFSLEFLPGGSLDRKFAGTPQPPDEAARLLYQLAAAMDCAHQKGIIHRDLKPANVLLAADGTPKISDFGLAKRLEEDAGQTHSGAILGTPSYMSPEQAEGNTHAIGPHSDVYALGAILYEALTGRVPFKGPTILDTLQQVRAREPVAPTLLQPKLPRDLETICLKCLQKDPKRRYENAGALAEDLRRVVNHEPILARPAGRFERAWRWCRRNPLGAAGAVAVVAWAVSMSVLAGALKVQKDETRRQKGIAEAKQREAERQQGIAEAKQREADQNALLAQREGKVARDRHEKAMILGSKLVEEVLERLQSRQLVTNAGAELRTLRVALIRVLGETMEKMARELEDSGATSFGLLATHQRLGDMLVRLGRSKEALVRFQKGTELARRLAATMPNSDKAQANLSVMVMRLGDMELALNGDARAARDHYREGLRLYQDVIDHPRRRELTAREHTISLSHHEMRLAKVELDLGDPVAAHEHFGKALKLRKAWWADFPDNDPERSRLAEAWMWQGVGDGHLGDEAGVRKAFGEARALAEALVKKHPRAYWFKEDLAEIQGHEGDALLRLGMVAEAKKSYTESLKALQEAPTQSRAVVTFRAMLALTEERLGNVAARESKGEAAKHYQAALGLRRELLQQEPNNLSWQTAYVRMQAHCGQAARAAANAAAILRKNPKSPVLLLEAARCYGACAATASAADLRKTYVMKAADAVRAALAGGYKDRMVLRSDPDLAALQKEPAYEVLLAGLAKR